MDLFYILLHVLQTTILILQIHHDPYHLEYKDISESDSSLSDLELDTTSEMEGNYSMHTIKIIKHRQVIMKRTAMIVLMISKHHSFQLSETKFKINI